MENCGGVSGAPFNRPLDRRNPVFAFRPLAELNVVRIRAITERRFPVIGIGRRDDRKRVYVPLKLIIVDKAFLYGFVPLIVLVKHERDGIEARIRRAV